MRIAWFSPLPPTRSGIAAYSVELLPYLERRYTIETFDEGRAHDFVWTHRQDPYDLAVYQLGNAPWHDYMWAYLAAYPGLVVLHDARLHHARARQLLKARRADDYRREFWHDHPDARRNAVEYAVEGMGGPIYYFWPMLRVVMQTARLVAVHNPRVAADLRLEYPDTEIATIRMGVPAMAPSSDRAGVRQTLGIPEKAFVFAMFGKVTAEKRVNAIERAVAALVAIGYDAHLLIVGERDSSTLLLSQLGPTRLANRVHLAGYVADEAIGPYLRAADACLCLRWPTALETSASWLRCLAAAKPTVVTDLAHTADVPDSVARRVDLLDEDRSLLETMRSLIADAPARAALARAGHEWWAAHHTMEGSAEDYRRAIDRAIARPAPAPGALPSHFREDYTALTREIAGRFGLRLPTETA
jgi:glycosyltransferase involved in cell wall biosynthesis